MHCRAPIVMTKRYGRVINKAANDLMEQAFVHNFEVQWSRLVQKSEEITGQATAVGDFAGRIELGEYQNLILAALDKLKRAATAFITLKEKMMTQKSDSPFSESPCSLSRTPSRDLYHKMESFILGNCHEEGLSGEETTARLQALLLPKPDLTRTCKFEILPSHL